MSKECSDLAVVDLAETSEVLPCDTGGHLAVLFKTARIEREDAVRFADELGGFLGDSVEEELTIPNRFTDEALQGSPIPLEAIGDGFDVFSFDVGQKPL